MKNGTTLTRYIDPMVAGMAAVHNGDGTGWFQHADWLGSSRLSSDSVGGVYYDRAYAPFGEVYAESNLGGTSPVTLNRNLTGQREDTTQGIDDFLFRQYSPSQGRWLVPDPAGLAAVHITNPQTWNRYAYLANNPLNAIDSLGLRPGVCPENAPRGGCPWGGYGDSGFIGYNGIASGVAFTAGTVIPAGVVQTTIDVGDGEPSIGGGFVPGNIYFTDYTGALSSLANYSSAGGGHFLVSGSKVQATGTISQLGKIRCAAAVANRLSLSNQPSLPGPSNPNTLDSGVAYTANALFGNTISGMVSFYDTVTTATNAAPVYGALLTNGIRMGAPGGGTLSQGAAGVAQNTVLQGAFANLGPTASAAAANFIGGLKFGYDGLTFLYGLYTCTNF